MTNEVFRQYSLSTVQLSSSMTGRVAKRATTMAKPCDVVLQNEGAKFRTGACSPYCVYWLQVHGGA